MQYGKMFLTFIQLQQCTEKLVWLGRICIAHHKLNINIDVLSDSVGNRPLFNLATTLLCIISSRTMNELNPVFVAVPSSSAK